MDIVDFRLGIEIRAECAVLPAIGAKDFIDPPFHFFYFSIGLDTERVFGVEQHGVCLFVVFRKSHICSCVHPLRSIRASSGWDRHQKRKEHTGKVKCSSGAPNFLPGFPWRDKSRHWFRAVCCVPCWLRASPPASLPARVRTRPMATPPTRSSRTGRRCRAPQLDLRF